MKVAGCGRAATRPWRRWPVHNHKPLSALVFWHGNAERMSGLTEAELAVVAAAVSAAAAAVVAAALGCTGTRR